MQYILTSGEYAELKSERYTAAFGGRFCDKDETVRELHLRGGYLPDEEMKGEVDVVLPMLLKRHFESGGGPLIGDHVTVIGCGFKPKRSLARKR